MKVKLTGINPQVYANSINNFFIKQLQKLIFPIKADSYFKSLAFEDDFRELVVIDGEEWCLDWFTYEEIKEVKV